MKSTITYTKFKDSDFQGFFKMAAKLWKSYSKSELKIKLKRVTTSKKYIIYLAKNEKGKPVGFSIFSVRTDYVEGAKKSPTGYFEGVFIKKNYRSLGIGKAFLQMGEKWCKKKKCTQLGSDTWITNEKSRRFHKSSGFWEVDELVHFLKDIS